MLTFRFKVIVRVLLIVLTLFVAFQQYYGADSVMISVLLLILFVFQVVLLIRYIDRTNKDLSKFLFSIKYSDFSQTFTNESLGGSFKDLNSAFNEVLQKFRKARSEKEENFRYLQTVVRHVGIGLISYDQKGKVELINNSAKRLLKVPHLNNIMNLNKISYNLGNDLLNLNTGDKKIIKVTAQDEIFQLMVYATNFKLKEKMYTLISLQNIQQELDETEMEAWQKLIRILTHEIMNSVAPIASLAETVEKMLPEHLSENSPVNEETFQDINNALTTIQKRSHGLIHFVDQYRSLVKIPRPNFQFFKIDSLMSRIESLMKNDLENYNIKFIVKIIPITLKLNADAEQIEQVLINLVINAIHAVKEVKEPSIEVTAYNDSYQKVNIIVKDNGEGVSKEIQDKIFIPFFTTKQEGSGIGLSLSRQIMRAHGGTIRIVSNESEYTSVILRF